MQDVALTFADKISIVLSLCIVLGIALMFRVDKRR